MACVLPQQEVAYAVQNDCPTAQGVKDNLPKHAKQIYKEAYNAAWEQYGEDEERAHRVAWSAVKKAGYQKSAEGDWRKAD